MITCLRRITVAALFLFLAPFLLVSGQSGGQSGGQNQTREQVRELEAYLADGQAQAASGQEREVRADFVLLLSGAEHSPTGKIIFRKMTLNSASATTGEFEILNQRGKRLFAGRWVAAAFQTGSTLISLEGEGSGSYAESRLKLKLKARIEGQGSESALLCGEGRGEIR